METWRAAPKVKSAVRWLVLKGDLVPERMSVVNAPPSRLGDSQWTPLQPGVPAGAPGSRGERRPSPAGQRRARGEAVRSAVAPRVQPERRHLFTSPGGCQAGVCSW